MSESQRFTWVLRFEGLSGTENNTKSDWADRWENDPDEFGSDCSTSNTDVVLVLLLWAMCLYYAFFYKHIGLCKMRFCLLFLVLIGNICVIARLITFGRSLALLGIYPLVLSNYYFVHLTKKNKALVCFSITACGELGAALQALVGIKLYDAFGGQDGAGFLLYTGMFVFYTMLLIARTWFAMPMMGIDDDLAEEETFHQRSKDDFREEGLPILAYSIPFYAFIKEPFISQKAYFKLEDNRRFFLICAGIGATSSVTYYISYHDIECGQNPAQVNKNEEAFCSIGATLLALALGIIIDKKKTSTSIPFAATVLCITGFTGLILAMTMRAHPVVYIAMAFLKVGTLGYLMISLLITFTWEETPYLIGLLHMTLLLLASVMAFLVSNPFGLALQLVIQFMTIFFCLYLGYHFEEKQKLDNEMAFDENATAEYTRRTTMMRATRM